MGDPLKDNYVVVGPHKHCFSCYSFTLCGMSLNSDDSCDFATCPRHCGAVYHGCKAEEHLLLCPNDLVDCINVQLGCPHQMLRKHVGGHLQTCPASIVMCMDEWNRWPVHTCQRRRHIPFKHINPHASPGQLDYDLTTRDQRILARLAQLPRKTKLILRNSLTRRYPPVPYKMPQSSESNPDLAPDFAPDLDFPESNVDKKAMAQVEQWEADLDARLKGRPIPPKYWEFPQLERGNIHKHCAYCVNLACPRKLGFGQDNSCALTSCRWKCGAVLHACKASEHMIICPAYAEPDEFDWMLRGVTNLDTRRSDRVGQKNQNQVQNAKLKVHEDFFIGPGEPAVKSKKKPPDPPTLPPDNMLAQSLYLDVRLDTVTRFQAKPRTMYTFLCSQEVRRDQYTWHVRNVHSDIMGGLNGWLEHRCPLASQGCGFSSRRLFPHNQVDLNHTLVFDQSLEAFGVTMATVNKVTKSKKKSKKSLTNLPVELLLIILDYLDSFSLCNLAMTSVYLRQVCCYLVTTRGCVSLQWEKVV